MKRWTIDFGRWQIIIDFDRAKWSPNYVLFVPTLGDPFLCTPEELLLACQQAKREGVRRGK